MDIKYNGGGCGCGAGSSVLPQNGGDNNNNNNSSNNGGLMGMLKGFMGGQNMPSNSGGPGSDGANMPIPNNGSSTMKRPQKKKSRKMNQQQMESQGDQPQMNSQGEAVQMKRPQKKKSRRKMNQQQMNSQGEAVQMKTPQKKKSRQMNQQQMNQQQGDQPQMNQQQMNQPKKLEAKAIVFNNGSTLQGQVANMQQNLNSITGKKKEEMSGGQNNLATLHNKINTIGTIVDDIKNSNNNSNSNLFGGNMYGGQNNLASLHDKVNAIGNVVEEIKESNSNNSSTSSSGFNLFGGKYPIANVFLKNTKAGGGVFDNIGNMFGMNPNSETNDKVNNSTPIEPINTSVETPNIVARTPVKNSQLPDPTSVVNRSNMEESENDEQPSTGGTGSSLVNSLFGGYRATRRNRKYLKRYKKGKSIGFTMKASLKAKGLIKRANGSKRVSKKYRG